MRILSNFIPYRHVVLFQKSFVLLHLFGPFYPFPPLLDKFSAAVSLKCKFNYRYLKTFTTASVSVVNYEF